MRGEGGESIRLDRWLHHARLFKTRTLAADAIGAGGIRLNGQPCSKPAQVVRGGDTVTVSAHGRVRVLRIVLLGERRGPATEAATLYEEL
ncbi:MULTISPECIES: RNA-binding S4 domain-containing protein [Paracoccus]|uniref:Heat shock protein Hsp15 n=1 Tax=Paracoccus versutus TaxID=34007 RepID=A0A3D9XQQ5_PARVE|nr:MULTISPECIES: RNA-binding S4 domain-containing protein [Paracoccus]REF72725.1 heat shock protein Hsp15 [Paracoccus versutus]WGR55339.1 RNA-binding S4 domain-containing protein [Paracoccus versutus]